MGEFGQLPVTEERVYRILRIPAALVTSHLHAAVALVRSALAC